MIIIKYTSIIVLSLIGLFCLLVFFSLGEETKSSDSSVRAVSTPIPLAKYDYKSILDKSSLIIVGKLLASRPLVDEDLMKKELGRKDSLPDSRQFRQGYLYKFEVVETLYPNLSEEMKTVDVLVLGNTFAVFHSKIMLINKDDNYLIFLSPANATDYPETLKVSTQEDIFDSERIGFERLFTLTEPTNSIVSLKHNRKALDEVQTVISRQN